MEVVAKKARVRNAEKDRKYSTCKFADRVFLCVKKKLHDVIKKGYWPEQAAPLQEQTEVKDSMMKESKQTVLAAFMIYDSKVDVLTCVSLGMGTKFIDQSQQSLCTGNLAQWGV
jgi:hypothetical protein